MSVKIGPLLYSGAWIITGGTHAGVMKHVGRAVRDHGLSRSTQGQIVAIGVATWGIIHNREALVHSEVRRTRSLMSLFLWVKFITT